MDIKGKKQNQVPQINPKPELVKLKVGADQNLQKIGVCLLEKVKNEQCNGQPNDVQVNLYYDQKQGYARMRESKQINDGKEQLIFQNITLQHANICPQFYFSRMEQQFQLIQQTTSIAVCGIIVDKDNHVLLTKRNHEMRTYPRCWVFPGGQVDAGESFVQTLYREIKEEVGLSIMAQQNQEEFDFEEELDQSPNNYQNEDKEVEEENTFKRQTRLQTKKQEKKKVDVNQVTKKDEFLTKSTVHLIEDPKPLFLYESVFPTDLRINYPQRSSLVIFYTLRIQESFRDIQLSQQRKEIDYSAWVSLELLGKLIEEESIKDTAFLNQQIETGISINHNYFPIGYNCFIGIYPNELGEGIGEAHIKAIRMLKKQTNNLPKKNK